MLDTAPVDLAVLGLGRDAHVAVNEPGSQPTRQLRGWARLLAEELRGLAGMARQRRPAMDAARLPEGP